MKYVSVHVCGIRENRGRHSEAKLVAIGGCNGASLCWYVHVPSQKIRQRYVFIILTQNYVVMIKN